jgi:hypothetical protein
MVKVWKSVSITRSTRVILLHLAVDLKNRDNNVLVSMLERKIELDHNTHEASHLDLA